MLIAAIYEGGAVQVLEADRSSLAIKIQHTLLHTSAIEVVIPWNGLYYACTPLGEGYSRKELEPGDERELYIPKKRR